ncbi:MAG: hypothetical protein JNG90_01905 [Planctomycetaceae bacterium]|nr:hypothetical protein [Planctomycetaceae bacterium]
MLYGFACLFVIGFLWGSLGGLGTALPATLERERLTQLLAPSYAVFVAWILQAILMEIGEQDEAVLVRDYGQAAAHFLQTLNYNWYDTDWVATLSAAGALLLFAAIRRRFDWATCFLLVLAAGWWIGFTLLTTALGMRMTPNRGDSWAGVLGMVAAAFIWLISCRMYAVAWSTLVAGLIGGLGFSGAAFIQLLELTSGYKTNWHSVLEQTYGFINGVGIGIAMVYLARRTPRVTDAQEERPWTDTFCVLFVLLGITWLNIRKNLPSMWLKEKTIPEEMYGLSATTWFTLAYLLLALAVVVPLLWHRRVRRIAIVPDSWLGKGQMLFLVFLWWIIVGNLSRYLPFNPLRMITEGTIHLNACLLTLLTLLLPTVAWGVPYGGVWDWPRTLKRTLMLGGAACALVILLEFAVTRVVWGDKFSGHGMRHIRFGPDSTAGKYKP